MWYITLLQLKRTRFRSKTIFHFNFSHCIINRRTTHILICLHLLLPLIRRREPSIFYTYIFVEFKSKSVAFILQFSYFQAHYPACSKEEAEYLTVTATTFRWISCPVFIVWTCLLSWFLGLDFRKLILLASRQIVLGWKPIERACRWKSVFNLRNKSHFFGIFVN